MKQSITGRADHPPEMLAGERRDAEAAAYSPSGPSPFVFPDGHAANVATGKPRLDVDAAPIPCFSGSHKVPI